MERENKSLRSIGAGKAQGVVISTRSGRNWWISTETYRTYQIDSYASHQYVHDLLRSPDPARALGS